MRYLSVCSGIEAASVACEPLGWKPLAFSEIEAFPRAVLAHQIPQIMNTTRYPQHPTGTVEGQTMGAKLIERGLTADAFGLPIDPNALYNYRQREAQPLTCWRIGTKPPKK